MTAPLRHIVNSAALLRELLRLRLFHNDLIGLFYPAIRGYYVRKLSIAAAFPDLGIWANNTYDYLGPSQQLAREYLAKTGQGAWSEEIETMIEQHHKFRKYKANPSWLVEPFRKADWIDVSRGRQKFGIPSVFVEETLSKFPNAGFHKRLIALTKQRLKTHPFSPLPMMRL